MSDKKSKVKARLRLTCDLPIHQKHGAFIGKEFDVLNIESGRGKKAWFVGAVGEKCAAFSNEYELVDVVPYE